MSDKAPDQLPDESNGDYIQRKRKEAAAKIWPMTPLRKDRSMPELWDLTPNEYQKQAMRTLCNQEAAQRRIESRELAQYLHAIIGLQGEVGELASTCQKWVWYGREFTREQIRQHIKDESGDILWYLAEGLSAFGLTLQEVMEANIAKLRVRYPEKYSDLLAAEENRNRTAEAHAVTGEVPRPRLIQTEAGSEEKPS